MTTTNKTKPTTSTASIKDVDKDKMMITVNVLDIILKSIGAAMLLIGTILIFYGLAKYLTPVIDTNTGENILMGWPEFIITGSLILGVGLITYIISEIKDWIKLGKKG